MSWMMTQELKKIKRKNVHKTGNVSQKEYASVKEGEKDVQKDSKVQKEESENEKATKPAELWVILNS